MLDRAPNPDSGYQFLLGSYYGFSVGLTMSSLDSLWTIWPPALRAAAERATPEERKRMTYDRYGLLEGVSDVRGRSREVPLNFTENRETGSLLINCTVCHAGKVIRIPVLSNTDGTSNAFFLAAQLATFRVGRGKNSPDLTRLPRRDIPPLSQWATETPAWFNAKKKKLYYHDGFIEDTPGDLMQFLMGPVTTGETIRNWYPQFQDLLAWMWSLEPPKWPEDTLGVIDLDLARSGLLVYTNYCAQCHGFYGAGGGRFTEGWRDQDIVKTDSMRLVGMGRVYRAFLRDGFFGADGTAPDGKAITILEPPGYIAPPLDGIWATPPYFHNGAVPTLMHVLDYNDRPKIWTRNEDGYDSLKVGLEIQEYEAVPDSVTEGWERRMFYQNDLPGKSVEGHKFPELPQKLTEDEITALIEYMKTL